MLSRTLLFRAVVPATASGSIVGNKTPGFSIVNVDEDITKGYRARFLYATSRDSVFLQYSKQIAPAMRRGPGDDTNNANSNAGGGNNPQDTRTFGRPLAVALPTNAIVRMLSALESATDSVEFTSRTASGTFTRNGESNYIFNMKGKSLVNQNEDTVPTEFDFAIDAGHAIILHRFLSMALSETMGFHPKDHNARLPAGNQAARQEYNAGGYARNTVPDNQVRNAGGNRGMGGGNRGGGRGMGGGNRGGGRGNNSRQQQALQQNLQAGQVSGQNDGGNFNDGNNDRRRSNSNAF
jgi:hypothetical protein